MTDRTFVLPSGAVIDGLELTQAGWRAALAQVSAEREHWRARARAMHRQASKCRIWYLEERSEAFASDWDCLQITARLSAAEAESAALRERLAEAEAIAKAHNTLLKVNGRLWDRLMEADQRFAAAEAAVASYQADRAEDVATIQKANERLAEAATALGGEGSSAGELLSIIAGAHAENRDLYRQLEAAEATAAHLTRQNAHWTEVARVSNQQRDAAEAERDKLLGRVSEYERPDRWPVDSQMRHVQDLVHALDIAHRKQAAAEAELTALAGMVERMVGQGETMRQLLQEMVDTSLDGNDPADQAYDWQDEARAVLAASAEEGTCLTKQSI